MARLSEMLEGRPATAAAPTTPQRQDAVPSPLRLSDAMRLSRHEVKTPPVDENVGLVDRLGEGAAMAFLSTPQMAANAVVYFGSYIRQDRVSSPMLGNIDIPVPEYVRDALEPLGDRMVAWGEARRQENQKFVQQGFQEEGLTGPEQVARDIGGGITSIAASLSMGLVAGPGAAALAFGTGAGLEGFVEATEKGRDFEDAQRIGAALGFAEGGLEFVGLSKFLKISGGPLRRAAISYVTEAVQESSQTAANLIIRTGFGVKEFNGLDSIIEGLADVAYSGAIGGVVGGAASIPFSMMQRQALETGLARTGMTKEDAKAKADEIMQKGMDDTMTAVESVDAQQRAIDDAVAADREARSREVENVPPRKGGKPGEKVIDQKTGKPLGIDARTPYEKVADKVEKIADLRVIKEHFEKAGQKDKAERVQEIIDRNLLTPEESRIFEAGPTDTEASQASQQPESPEIPAEQAAQEIPEIPAFRSTEDAVAFGEANKDVPGIVEALQANREDLQRRAREASDAGNDAEAFRLFQLAQFPREAIETINETINLPKKETVPEVNKEVPGTEFSGQPAPPAAPAASPFLVSKSKDIEATVAKAEQRQQLTLEEQRVAAEVQAEFEAEQARVVKDLIKNIRGNIKKEAGEEFGLIPRRLFAKDGGVSLDSLATENEQLLTFLGYEATADGLREFIREHIGEQGEGGRVLKPDKAPAEGREILGRINALIRARDKRVAAIIKRVGDRLSTSTTPQQVKKQVRKATGQVKDQGKKVSERKAFLQSLKDRVKAARQAEKMTKDEVARAQQDVIDLIEGADMAIKDRARFIRFIKNVQSREDFLKSSQRLLARIEKFEAMTQKERARRAKVRDLYLEIRRKEFKKADNLRKLLELPRLSKMSTDQLTTFAKEIRKFQQGDEFLSLRKLQTVENTDLSGIKTVREAKERLAAKMGIDPSELDNIDVGPLDKFRYDTVLAKQNPFYQFLVDETNASLIDGEARFLEVDKEIDRLVKEARASRKRSVLDKAVPSDRLVFQWLEAPLEVAEDGGPTKADLSREMTPEELELAGYLQTKFAEYRDYLIEHKVLEKYQSNYITHVRRGFLEAWKEDGLLGAFKEVFKQYQQDETVFRILEDDTGNILPLEKFFQFAMQRTGGLKPSLNVAKAFKAYAKTFYKKQALDRIVPALDIYAYTLSPKEVTPRGLQMNRRLIKFVREWVNNKKGRRTSLGGVLPQNGAVDLTLRVVDSFITLIDLGLNIPVSLTVAVGENVSTFVNLGAKQYSRGLVRVATARGRKILSDNEAFVGKSPWRDLGDTADTVGDKFSKAMFYLFNASQVNANKIHLLGSLTKDEWARGEISTDRLAAMKREIGRFRAVSGAKSIFGATSVGGAFTKYKTWALPILNTIIDDLATVSQMVSRGDFNQTIKSREFNELLRSALTMTTMVVAMTALLDDEDKTFVGKILAKARRESLTILQALDPTVLSSVRLLAFVEDLAIALKQTVLLEKYQRKSGYKGPAKFRKTLVPRALKQFEEKEQKRVTIK